MKKGKLVVIEGIDSSGKGSQLRLLKKRIEEHKHKVVTSDFPRYYTSPFGKMVGDLLTNKYGKFEQIDPHLALLPYMLDQYTWSRDVGNRILESGSNIILDRYFISNVHQVAKKRGPGKKIFREWLWWLGFDDLKITKPDLVLFLDVTPSITKKLLRMKEGRSYLKGKKKDEAEKNWKHQESSYKEYLYMTKKYDYWKKIKCVTRGKLDEPEIINSRIWKEVEKVLD